MVPNHEYAIFEVTAPTETSVALERLSLTRRGSGSLADFERIAVTLLGEPGEAIADFGPSSTDTVELTFDGDIFRVPAGEPMRFSVRADVAATSDTDNRFCVDAPSDVRVVSADTGEPLPVAGGFPVCGNAMTSRDLGTARLTYSVRYPSTADLTVGETDVTLMQLSVANSDAEDVQVDELVFSLRGISWDQVANPTLQVSGVLAALASIEQASALLALALDDAPIERGGTVVFELRGDIAGGACEVLNVDFDSVHSTATGSTYGFHVPWEMGVDSEPPFDRQITGVCP